VRALKKSNVINDLIVAHDGVEALDYLMGTGPHADDPPVMPQLVLLDLKLPRWMVSRSYEEYEENELTRRLPVVVFTSSSEEEDMIKSYDLGAIATCASRWSPSGLQKPQTVGLVLAVADMNLHPLMNDGPTESFTY